MSETGPRPPSGTQALDRALDLVDLVVRADEPMTWHELLVTTDLAKSTLSRLLGALERGGMVARTDDGAYVAGSLFWLYGARHDPWEETIQLARPEMEQLGELTRETIHLSVVRNDQVAQVAQVDSTYFLGTRDWTEVHVPPHTTALGKVFFAWEAIDLPEEDLEQLTDHTLTDVESLRRDCELSRRRGWTLSHDELEIGLLGLGVPVRGIHGDVVAALGLSGPTPRLDGRLDELAGALTERAARLSSLLRDPSTARHQEGVA